MLKPKTINREAIPAALEKAHRYRLLNEPAEAESICRDILQVDPENQAALVTMLLSLTDQFVDSFTESHDAAKVVLPRLRSPYQRAYYEGIIHERWAKAQLDRGLPSEAAASWLREALHCYDKAEGLSSPDDPDAILRWNTCLRVLGRLEKTTPPTDSRTRDFEAEFSDEGGQIM